MRRSEENYEYKTSENRRSMNRNIDKKDKDYDGVIRTGYGRIV